MAKSRTERLRPVARVVASRELEAAKLLNDTQRNLDEREARLNELYAFRAEYLRRLHEQGTEGIDATTLIEYQSFLAKLDVAVGQQEELVQRAQRDCAQRRADWSVRHRQSAQYDKVIQHCVEAEREQATRREQRLNDEHGARRTGNKNPT